jgi:SPOR domain
VPAAIGAPSPAIALGANGTGEDTSVTGPFSNAPHAPPRRPATRHPAPPARVLVQLSAYYDHAKARAAAALFEKSLRKLLDGTALETEQGTVQGRTVWRVVAGPVASRQRGERLCNALRDAGRSCIVIMR